MALSAFPSLSKSLTLGDGTKYALVHVAPATASVPTFLLLHGFPSSSYDWRHQIEALKAGGFGVVAPDLLGYGDTDSPSALEPYSTKNMSGHIAEILKQLGIDKVIGVGHDWGSGLLSSLHIWHPECLVAVVFIAVGYIEAGTMNIDEINALTEQLFGYPAFGYWKLFGTAEAAKLMDSNPDSVFSLIFPEKPETWKTDLSPIGAAESWISSGKTTPYPSWLTAEEATTQKRIIAKKGYASPLNWYKSVMRGLDTEHVAGLPEDRKYVKVPSLLVLAQNDYTCKPEMARQTASLLKDPRFEEVSSGHWAQLEKPNEVNNILIGFAQGL